jgi:pyruvate-formate lyase
MIDAATMTDAEVLNGIGEYFLAGHMACDEDDPAAKYASGIYNEFKNAPLSIEPDYEIAPVRGLFRGEYCAPLYNGMVMMYDPQGKKQQYNDERVTAAIDRSTQYWKRYDVLDTLKSTFDDEDKAIFAVNGQEKYQFFFSTWQGHATLDYATILRTGLAGYEARITEKLESLDRNSADYDKKSSFYRALLVVVDGVGLLARRYRDECERLAGELPPDDSRGARLRALQGAFESMLVSAPSDFFEAIQRLHFFYTLDGSDNAGRIDQLLYPYYASDLRAGKIDRKRAEDLLFQVFDIWGQVTCWNMRSGGCEADGSSAVNDLTFAVLDARKRVRRPKPSVSLSITPTTSGELLHKAFEVMETGVGQPALYNDELYIKTLEAIGVPTADAVEYTFGGCTETHIAGKSAIRDAFVNVAKCLELALYNGRVSRGGDKLGIETGDPAGFQSFSEFASAYKRQVEHMIDVFVGYRNRTQEITARTQPAMFRSVFVEGCIESGVSNSEGGAVYNYGLVDVFGIPNVANSLFVIKKLVYEDKALSMPALIEALDSNFEGFEDIRQLCRAQDKYGNDRDGVDDLARVTAGHVFEYIKGHKLWNGGIYYAFCASKFHDVLGESTGATPDGRFAGTPLADSMGPVQGTDTNGPTAMLNSVTKVNLSAAIGTPVVNIKFRKPHFCESEYDNLSALVRTYFAKGGMQLQFNIVNRETLLDAIDHPENYGDLIVRVAGYCDYFNNLPLEVRREMAERSEY